MNKQTVLKAAQAIFYERYPEGSWDTLDAYARSTYVDQAQAALSVAEGAPTGVRRLGVPVNQSIATKRVTLRLKLDWIKKATANSEKMLASGKAYGDPGLDEATRVFVKAGQLIAELLDDDEVNGPGDLGREFVRRYAAMGRLSNRLAGRRSR